MVGAEVDVPDGGGGNVPPPDGGGGGNCRRLLAPTYPELVISVNADENREDVAAAVFFIQE